MKTTFIKPALAGIIALGTVLCHAERTPETFICGNGEIPADNVPAAGTFENVWENYLDMRLSGDFTTPCPDEVILFLAQRNQCNGLKKIKSAEIARRLFSENGVPADDFADALFEGGAAALSGEELYCCPLDVDGDGVEEMLVSRTISDADFLGGKYRCPNWHVLKKNKDGKWCLVIAANKEWDTKGGIFSVPWWDELMIVRAPAFPRPVFVQREIDSKTGKLEADCGWIFTPEGFVPVGRKKLEKALHLDFSEKKCISGKIKVCPIADKWKSADKYWRDGEKSRKREISPCPEDDFSAVSTLKK